ncbi:phage tail protein [Eggerthellaceae bacterium zg-893]|nr:phage tail protein [Eggerthellaceae bacterium zg-893]
MPEAKVYHGLSNVAVAFCKPDGSYETPEKTPGAVKMAWESSGESQKFYADNGAYFVLSSSSGASGEIEAGAFPDRILARMLGWTIDENGALVETTDGVAEPFALLYEIQSDTVPRRGVAYKLTASAPKEEWTTDEENPNVKTTVLPFDAVAVDVGGRMAAKATLYKANSPEAFAAFYDDVYIPSFASDAGPGQDVQEDETE